MLQSLPEPTQLYIPFHTVDIQQISTQLIVYETFDSGRPIKTINTC